ncbi:MAG TPA: sigma-70 family RNA polymerase sigma factor [Bacteroidia bacterium]|jgi:RNA polymerase sigma-70 factor (ECF subfamily)|nr:sigma-70 family RNA polymerase sigma factor [Bacteroidia bacterium]
MTTATTTTQQFISLRPYLFKIAYNMTGAIEEAEDIVQDVCEKWLKSNRPEVANPKAYLARMVVNQSINRLNDLKTIRENYIGFWLPEPYVTLETNPELPSIDYGLLMLLERLNPLERAVFILRESFSESYASIADLTGQSEDNCRQLLHRSREKIQHNTIKPVNPEKHRALTEAFLSALYQQDRSVLEKILRQDIELYGDGGGKKAAALKPLFGIDKVLKFLLGVTKLENDKSETYTYKPGFFNGQPAALLYSDSTDELDSAVFATYDETGISRLHFIRNPEKLKIR